MRNLLLKRPKREDVVGRHIYAFVKNRTNQVLYSFSRTLRPQDLKQLPDAGANNTPPSLRKDEWRPLWTVSIPGTPTTSRINQELITKLRDYRMLHELCWEMPESITKPFDEEEIKQMKDKLKRRGGSKKESVYDVIKHKKKKLRAQMVMDQKANSVADLAAGLLQISDQEASDLALEEARQKREEVALLVRLSNDFEETIRDSNEEYLQLKSSVSPEISELGADEPISQDGLEDSMKPEAASVSTKLSPELRAAMDEIHAKQARSKYAVEELVRARENLQKQVEDLAGQIKIAEARLDSRSDETDKEKSTNENDAKSDASSIELRLKMEKFNILLTQLPTQKLLDQTKFAEEYAAEIREARLAAAAREGEMDAESRNAENAVASSTKETKEILTRQSEISNTVDTRAHLLGLDSDHPLYPPSEKIFPVPSDAELRESNIETLEALLPRMPTEYIGDDIVPGLRKYDTSGITIQWADIYDAQFAAEWPKDVKHVPMGILRHTPPAPTHASVTDTLDSRQIYRDGHPLADGPAHDMATFKASQWRRTRGVPTETTPVNFAHPKDSSQTAPWLQTDDTDALEALRARQRAWNATHAPRKDTWEPFASTDQPSTPNDSADQPTNSYQAAIARKEKLARLQEKLIDKTLPDVDTSNEPSVKLVMSTPRITNLNAFRDLPQTVLALRAAASARAAKREAEREALRQSMAEEEAARQLGDEERAARKQEADLVRQKAEEEKARDPEAFEAARAARRAAREEAYLAERNDAPARAVKREAALQLKAMRQAAAEKQRVRMQAARELQAAARQKAHAALLEARTIGKEKRLEETAARRLQEQKIKEQKARDAKAFEATRAARRMARNAAKNSKPSKVARQAMRKEAYLARQAAEK